MTEHVLGFFQSAFCYNTLTYYFPTQYLFVYASIAPVIKINVPYSNSTPLKHNEK